MSITPAWEGSPLPSRPPSVLNHAAGAGSAVAPAAFRWQQRYSGWLWWITASDSGKYKASWPVSDQRTTYGGVPSALRTSRNLPVPIRLADVRGQNGDPIVNAAAHGDLLVMSRLSAPSLLRRDPG